MTQAVENNTGKLWIRGCLLSIISGLTALAIFGNTLISVSSQAIVTSTPTPPPLSFSIKAPWPAGVTFQAGGAGSYYRDCKWNENKKHCNHDILALDFNGLPDDHITPEEIDDEGVLVLAVADGEVQEAGERVDGYGWNVVIGHAYGIQSRYAHLQEDKLLVSDGDWVTQGTPLGYIGGSGGVKPHLHYAMYYCNTTLSKEKCNLISNLESRLPEPLNGYSNITDGQQIASTNYGIGYEEIRTTDLRDASNLRFHNNFKDTYQIFGGQYFVFGSPESPVQIWPGTNSYYQEFGPATVQGFPWTGMNSALVENGQLAYLLIGPIWEIYKREGGPSSSLGLPVSHSYEWVKPDLSPRLEGYRSDFERGSVIWFENGEEEILTNSNAKWQTSFYPNANDFSKPGLIRRDKYIDYEWTPRDTSGSLNIFAHLGRSVLWETRIGGLLSWYRLSVVMQGNIQIEVDGKIVLEQYSPDMIWRGKSTQIGIGEENVVIRFWQEAGKEAKIAISADNVIKIPEALASEGAVEVNPFPDAGQIDYADYNPPPYPGASVQVTPIGTSTQTQTILVFDSSGSMNELDQSGKTKLDAAKAAGANILDLIKAEGDATGAASAQVGLVDFNFYAQVDTPLTADISAAEAALQGLFADGGTGMPDGLKTALDLLPATATDRQSIVILLSDGLPNIGHGNNQSLDQEEVKQQVLEQAVRAGEMGVCIYTVGFGVPGAIGSVSRENSIDEDLLRQIFSTAGCGSYYNAENANQLANVYVELRHVSTGNLLLRQTGQIAQDQQVDIGQVDLPANQAMLLYTLNWPGSRLDPVLVDPAGRTVDINYPGASISTSDTLASVIIDHPRRGQWRVAAQGVDVPEGVTTYNALLSSRVETTITTGSPGLPLAVVILMLVGSGVGIYTITRKTSQKRDAAVLAKGSQGALLIGIQGEMAGRNVSIKTDALVIGRSSSSGLQLRGSSVSRQHAAIRYAQGSWFIQDLGSSGGTFVNGQRVQAIKLNPGDQIAIGGSVFVFQKEEGG